MHRYLVSGLEALDFCSIKIESQILTRLLTKYQSVVGERNVRESEYIYFFNLRALMSCRTRYLSSEKFSPV